MQDLTGFQRDILFIIAGMDGPNGLEIKRELEAYYGKKVRHGRLYPNLDELVDLGMIEKTAKNKRANEYHLLDRGNREIEARMVWQQTRIDPEFDPDPDPDEDARHQSSDGGVSDVFSPGEDAANGDGNGDGDGNGSGTKPDWMDRISRTG